jgi:hypothetical protein
MERVYTAAHGVGPEEEIERCAPGDPGFVPPEFIHVDGGAYYHAGYIRRTMSFTQTLSIDLIQGTFLARETHFTTFASLYLPLEAAPSSY